MKDIVFKMFELRTVSNKIIELMEVFGETESLEKEWKRGAESTLKLLLDYTEEEYECYRAMFEREL